jgi:1,5-anhydro-D-fructose reductase (1,5-anhydro-D-mannitol-forming)
MTLGWGIVGLGKIAENAIAPAIGKIADARLVSVSSRAQERADAFAKRHGAERGVASYEALLADPEVDIVYIGTPNSLHAEQVVAAAQAGKHVFCDKPLATSSADAERAVEACAANGVKLGINFQKRHQQSFIDARRLIAGGAIGNVLVCQIELSAGAAPLSGWRSDPNLAGLGAISNVGVHAYDLLRFLLDCEIRDAVVLTDAGTREELETTALALLRFENGAIAYVNANQTTPHHQPNIEIQGTEGRIVGLALMRHLPEGGELRVLTRDGETVRTTVTEDAVDRSVAAFQAAVRDGSEPNASGADGARSAQLVEALERSAHERTVVELSR